MAQRAPQSASPALASPWRQAALEATRDNHSYRAVQPSDRLTEPKHATLSQCVPSFPGEAERRAQPVLPAKVMHFLEMPTEQLSCYCSSTPERPTPARRRPIRQRQRGRQTAGLGWWDATRSEGHWELLGEGEGKLRDFDMPIVRVRNKDHFSISLNLKIILHHSNNNISLSVRAMDSKDQKMKQSPFPHQDAEIKKSFYSELNGKHAG